MSNFTDAWNIAYEGIPADTEQVLLGAGRERALKLDLRERLSVDHSWSDGLTVNSNDGKHVKVTLRVQSGTPTLDATDGALYTQAVNGVTELFYEDSAGHTLQLSSNGALNFTVATATGNFTVNQNLTVQQTSTFNGVANFPGAIGDIGGDVNFYLKNLNGHNAIAFASGVWVQWNSSSNQFEFFSGGVLVGHIP
jgi:hypothetical protein